MRRREPAVGRGDSIRKESGGSQNRSFILVGLWFVKLEVNGAVALPQQP